MNRGRLITIEGIDGAGKTTLAAGLLRRAARRAALDVELLREPGGVEAAERIRALVKDPDLRVGARTEALLYAAARAQLVEEALEPLLSAGTWVLLDRFVDSSLAYQGGGRELGIDAVRAINEFATGRLAPGSHAAAVDRPAAGTQPLARARGEPPDRLERERRRLLRPDRRRLPRAAAAGPGPDPDDRRLAAARARSSPRRCASCRPARAPDARSV